MLIDILPLFQDPKLTVDREALNILDLPPFYPFRNRTGILSLQGKLRFCDAGTSVPRPAMPVGVRRQGRQGREHVSFLFRCWLATIICGYLVLAAAEPEQNALQRKLGERCSG
jgi:hypothetical protein